MSNYWQKIQTQVTPSLEEFSQKLKNPLYTQTNKLKEIIYNNRHTIFGEKYEFTSITSYEEYAARIPIHEYADLAPYIQQIADGRIQVLCHEGIVAFEMTGGSTQGAKLIPYTATGLAAFQQAILPWIADLLQQKPEIKLGRTYWAISPVTRQSNHTPSGIPIGMVSDAAYFGQKLEDCILHLLAVPPEVSMVADIKEWRYLTALYLLAAEDISFISVWSPTFLLQIIEEIQLKYEDLIADIATGKSTSKIFSPERAEFLKQAVFNDIINFQKVWQKLSVISCWTDAAAKAFISQLQDLFPHVLIQGKGLLATEGVVTIPLVGCNTPVLAIDSGFYEFLDDNEQPRLCHQLVLGEIYRVVITTASGLYRYDLGDKVLVKGWFQATPLLEFVGRGGIVSDLCGEKLTEDFVLSCLGKQRGFAMLVPHIKPHPHYVLFLDGDEYDANSTITQGLQLDLALAANPQYEYARKLRQLGQLETVRVKNPLATYINYALSRGQRLGDIKPPALNLKSDWELIFSILP
ncbi:MULTISPECIES: GH3 auxin-responsive promoter family protein [unclassified Nodularia (in: cyanobacteria)]|uniref:GH3 auxin-responsive promoter family protein n=1 Tax=unclassified Nodularia (in: cyanobacteria) TaxID=2656917 RepID=UPI00187E51A0|nr:MULTISPECIES: GH3 auxin-responsive promoter family protein [unclassified Nodularia (in: cyanobacteria)]MBE9198495.1 GH3 auxin-responsive promoter family protein [Nodularia sp. LEGE 06071]MCC2691040.1 GH3 auxin-responsive promoter family protein [Nodularia sp. LEGE 04288]